MIRIQRRIYTKHIYAKTLTEGMGASGGPHPGSRALLAARDAFKEIGKREPLTVPLAFVPGHKLHLSAPSLRCPFWIQISHRSCLTDFDSFRNYPTVVAAACTSGQVSHQYIYSSLNGRWKFLSLTSCCLWLKCFLIGGALIKPLHVLPAASFGAHCANEASKEAVQQARAPIESASWWLEVAERTRSCLVRRIQFRLCSYP